MYTQGGKKRFDYNNEIIPPTNALFEDHDRFYYLEGNKKILEKRWTKSIRLKENYDFILFFVFHSSDRLIDLPLHHVCHEYIM